jgi:D-arabinose 1-dehydrogenase-like Zn-dependent alcohol dehydrogenase
MTPRTHLAVRAVGDGRLEFTRLQVAQPAKSQVRIRVEACNICRLDAATVEGYFPGLIYPRIPGHAVVGRIEARGEGVSDYAIGQRVAVGLPAERCGRALICGVSVDGGYAETMIAHQNALVSVPDGLNPVNAAPLLCTGLTIYHALKRSNRSGDVVAVFGLGSFGLLALQFARHMGFRTVVIGRTAGTTEDDARLFQAVGGAAAIVALASSEPSAACVVDELRHGRSVVVHAGSCAQLHVAAPTELADVLHFCSAHNIRPHVETTSLVDACEAYRRVMRRGTPFCVIDMRLPTL